MIDELRRRVHEGIELPARAIVRASRATTDEYSADVEITDRAGKPTGQKLDGVALDSLWLQPDGVGVWAPPAPDQHVLVGWSEADAGHPVIVAAAPLQPPAPRLPVAEGERSVQTAEWDQRQSAAEWRARDNAGAEVSGMGSRWRVAGPGDSLLPILEALCDVIINGATVPDHDTPSGGTGAPLAMGPAMIAAATAVKARLPLVLRS